MTTTNVQRSSTAICLAISLVAFPAFAGSVKVSSNGADSPTCGSGSAPCATIAQAVANSSDGDTILIGAGRYAGTTVDKRLKFQSKNGQGGAMIISTMNLIADKIVLGLPGKGFAFVGGGSNCVTISANDVTVRGNAFTHCDQAVSSNASGTVIRDNSFNYNSIGVSISGSGALVRRNRFAYFSTYGIFLMVSSSNAYLRENVLFGPSGTAILIGGSDHLIRRNLLHGTPQAIQDAGGPSGVQLVENTVINASNPSYYLSSGSDWILDGNAAVGGNAPGFYLSGGVFTLDGNVANGNNGGGIYIFGGSGHVLVDNSAIDNFGLGISLSPTGTVTVKGGNLYGNTSNCGLDNSSSASIIAEKVYWGSPSGPGADPADNLCGNTAAITVTNPRASAARIKMPKVK